MARKLLLLFLALAACSKGPQADLQYIGDARSLAAEWALVNEQAAQGKLTDVYARSMRKWLRRQLESDSAAVTTPNTAYAVEMRALLAEPDNASPDALRGHADNLKRQEDALESA